MSKHNKQNVQVEPEDRRQARKRIDDLMDWIIWGDEVPFSRTLPTNNDNKEF